MKKFLFLIIILLVAVMMMLTRPDKKAHKEAMMKAVKEYVDEEAANKGLKDNWLTRQGKSVVNKGIEAVLSNKLKLNDYYLFNTTHVKMGDEEKMLSLGLFGQVITFDKDMLRDALEEAAQEKAEAKAAAKEAKAAAKEARKAEKQREKELKRKQKEERKAQKQREKEEKKRKKEQEKAA